MTAPFVPASEKQLAFITDLLGQKVVKPETKQMMEEAVVGTKLGEGDKSVSKSQASKWIEWLLAQERLPKEAKPKPTYIDPPEGMHASEGPEGKGQITKVYKTRAGHTVAKALVQGHDGKWGFDYRGKAGLKGLSEATLMSAEEAKAFGKTYGICVNCAADLTDERSIYAGYGPVCAMNRGWWYPSMAEALAGLELSEKGEAMTKLVEMVEEGAGLPKWTTEGEGIDTEWVTEHEGYLVSVFPVLHAPGVDTKEWGIYLAWGTPMSPMDTELPEKFKSAAAARVAAIKWIDERTAELVKFEKEIDAALAGMEADEAAGVFDRPPDFVAHIPSGFDKFIDEALEDDAAMFDTPKPPVPTLTEGKTLSLSGGGGPIIITAGSPAPGYGGAGAKVTYPAKFEVEDVRLVEEEEIDDDEPEFVEIPLESLLLGDDL